MLLTVGVGSSLFHMTLKYDSINKFSKKVEDLFQHNNPQHQVLGPDIGWAPDGLQQLHIHLQLIHGNSNKQKEYSLVYTSIDSNQRKRTMVSSLPLSLLHCFCNFLSLHSKSTSLPGLKNIDLFYFYTIYLQTMYGITVVVIVLLSANVLRSTWTMGNKIMFFGGLATFLLAFFLWNIGENSFVRTIFLINKSFKTVISVKTFVNFEENLPSDILNLLPNSMAGGIFSQVLIILLLDINY